MGTNFELPALLQSMRQMPHSHVKSFIKDHIQRPDGLPLSDRDVWLVERTQGIGGSDIGALLGLNKYKTALDLFNEKQGAGLFAEESPSEAAYWGNTLESIVAQEFQMRTGLKVQAVNGILRHPGYPYMCASIDRAIVNLEIAGNVRIQSEAKRIETGRLLSTDTILEVKTTSAFAKEWGKEDDAVPLSYLCQVQWYMGITGASICHLAVLVGGQKFKMYRVERNKEFIDHIQSVARDFWVNHVLTGIAPEPMSAEEAKAKWPIDNGDTVEVSNNLYAEIGLLEQLEAEEKAIKERITQIKDNVKLFLRDSSNLTLAGNVIATYKASAGRVSFNTDALKEDHPEIYQKYMKEGKPIRTLRFK